MQIEIRRVRYGRGVAADLTRAALADLGQRYGGEGDETPVDPAEFEPPAGAFFVAYLDGAPVACGGWRTFAEDPDVAEVKRMYTAPEARGRGVATAVLRAIEQSARDAGRKRVWLETGTAQPEAIALYLKLGYLRIPDFGYYKTASNVRSYGRDL